MTTRLPLLVFSDLDGTLLTHEDYSWDPAAETLGRLRDMGAGVILATSKTAAEVAPIRAAIGFADWPAIVENGGGLLEAGQEADGDAGDYPRLRALLRDLPPGFQGFGDLSAEGVAQVTGLDLDAARAAQARRFTEPGLWTGDEAGLAAFLDAAAGVGLTARRGGRFLTLSFGATKRDQMDRLIRRFAPVRTVALGDAPNDVEMLTHADLGVIVANPASLALPPLPGEAEGRIRRTRAPGPLGWAEAMTDILNDNRLSGDSLRHG